jgi:hypothetical protein
LEAVPPQNNDRHYATAKLIGKKFSDLAKTLLAEE